MLPSISTSQPLITRKISFTSTADEWYRVLDETSTGGQVSGLIRVYGVDSNGVAWGVMASFSAQGSAPGSPSLTQLYCTGDHAIDAIRTTTDGAGHTAVDILTNSTASKVTVELTASPLNNPVSVPTGGVAGLGGTELQFFVNSAGLRTSGNIVAGADFEFSNGVGNTSGAGAPTSAWPNGSTYQRSDGSGTTDNFYIRRGGAWVGIA